MQGDGGTAPGSARVRRRRLLFIPGYDPRSPAAYHRMWRDEAPRQAAVSGGVIDVGPRKAEDGLFLNWTVRTAPDNADDPQATETRVTLMRWDDLVRRRWLRGPWRTIGDIPRWMWALMRAGAYGHARRMARPGWLCMMTPPLLMAALTLLAGLTILLIAVISPWAALAAALAAPWAVVWLWARIDSWAGVGWASQSFSYMTAVAEGLKPDEDARIDLFARRLIDAVDESWADEVVLTGFSQGAALAVRTLARALTARPDLGRGPDLDVNLLTVGQSLYLQSILGNETFREALKSVAKARAVGWTDVTSASDPASTCTVHPLHGVLEAPDPQRPLRRPPRFHKILDPERFRVVRRNPLLFHFQYLMASDRAGGHDWFALTAGPEPVTATGVATTGVTTTTGASA